jgi:pyruvate,orthophosphate dikinase
VPAPACRYAQAETLIDGRRHPEEGRRHHHRRLDGQVLKGEVPMLQPELSGDFGTLMGWADAVAAHEGAHQCRYAGRRCAPRSFGAEGIGLCRTEHMFFEATASVMREMILADRRAGRRVALAKLLPMQRWTSSSCSTIMHGLPVTIRLLDPPLHEFLPKTDEEIEEVRAASWASIRPAAPARPMRCTSSTRCSAIAAAAWRSPIPEIAEMQARAIFEAGQAARRTGAAGRAGDHGAARRPEGSSSTTSRRGSMAVANAVMKERASSSTYLVGTMIELPRAAIAASDGRTAEFFSFGTNDLTQTTFGIARRRRAPSSRPTSAKGILEQRSVRLARFRRGGRAGPLAAERGRKTRNDLKLGICGEHGGDPASIHFCEDEVGLDYVSCSPFRVPIARLAAAQAALGKN